MPRTQDANVVSHSRVRSLQDAIRRVQMGEVERSDVVVDLQDTERARLELLSDELKDVFNEIPADDDQFRLQIAGGATPRLWIDVTSHIAMGNDRRTYRFLKDTRLGRTVILETPTIDDMADCVTEYIAERILEREKALEGDWLKKRLEQGALSAETRSVSLQKAKDRSGFGLIWLFVALSFVVGLAVGVGLLTAFAGPVTGSL